MSPVDPTKSMLAARHETAPPTSPGFAAAPHPTQLPIPAILSGAPNLFGLLRALRRRWLLALVVATVGAALTWLVVTLLMPAPYTASTRLVFERRPPGYLINEQSGEMSNLYRSQIPVFRSKDVLGQPQVRSLPFLPTDPGERYAYLDKTVTVEVPSNQEVLRVSASGEDPQELAELANKLVAAYIQSLREKTEAHRKQLDQNYESAARLLDQKRQGLTTRNTTRALELERQVQQTQLDRKKAKAELDVLEGRKAGVDKTPVPEGFIDEYLRTDTDYLNLQTQLLRIERTIRGIADKSLLGEDDPQLAGSLQKRTALRNQVAARRKEVKPQVQEQYVAALRAEYDQEVTRLKGVLKSLEELEKVLQQDLTAEGGSKSELTEYQRMMTEMQVLENHVKRIDSERKSLDISDRDPTAWLRVLGEATPPTTRTRDKQFKIGGVATGGAFLLLLALVAFVEFRAQRLNSTDEVVQGLGMPLVGTIPALPARVRNSPVGSNPKDAIWQNQLTEAVDALRTFLIRMANEQPCVVMITSAVAGEGKTSLASQLAASLARAWRKTLFIDGDLRKPAAHLLFELPQEPGFSEVLRNELEVSDVVRPTPLSRLWLMPAGQYDPHALQALAQEGVSNLFTQLKEEYDFIIVDSCPVLPVADTLLLGQHADTVIFSALRGETRLPTLYAAQQRLLAIDIPILGVVVIGARGTLGGLDIQYPRPVS